MLKLVAVFVLSTFMAAGVAAAEEIGSTSTAFKFLGPNSKIVIEAFDDPDVSGVTCHVSYPTKGGISGAMGFAEERSEASIACRQIGPIAFRGKLSPGTEVFAKSRSPLFKKLHVYRFHDAKRNVLVYLAATDKLIDGSPKHSLSSVPIMPWR